MDVCCAGRYLPGGGLGLFVLPPEVNLVIVEGHGGHVTDARGRDFIDSAERLA